MDDKFGLHLSDALARCDEFGRDRCW